MDLGKRPTNPLQQGPKPSCKELLHRDFLFLSRSRKLPALAASFHGKSLPAALTVRAVCGGIALFLPIYPACLKRYIFVVCVAYAAELSTECAPPAIFVDFAPAFPSYEKVSAWAATWQLPCLSGQLCGAPGGMESGFGVDLRY